MLRKLMLLATMVVAALALSATSAMAQEAPVEVINEATLEHCDPCSFVVEGESRLNSVLGPEISNCVDTFEGEIYEDGSGHVPENSIDLTDHTGEEDCNSVPCADVEWPFQAGEVGPADEHLSITFCLQGGLPPCTIEVDVVEISDHHYRLLAINDVCHGQVIVNGDWEIHNSTSQTTHGAIEIIH